MQTDHNERNVLWHEPAERVCNGTDCTRRQGVVWRQFWWVRCPRNTYGGHRKISLIEKKKVSNFHNICQIVFKARNFQANKMCTYPCTFQCLISYYYNTTTVVLSPLFLAKRFHVKVSPSIRCFTCLWVKDLWGEVRWRRARGEVFIAVGDEGRQRVDMVSMLYHWDFIGLKETQRAEGEQQVPDIMIEESDTNVFFCTSVLFTHQRIIYICIWSKHFVSHKCMIHAGYCTTEMHAINRP